jgi:hypothetical protein
MSGVSIDNPSAPSDADLYMRLAVEGGSNFMKRLQLLADAKASHDESLAELNLGKTAQSALDDAQAKQVEAAAKLSEVDATLEAAKKTAADTIAQADKAAAQTADQAKTDADALTAEAQRIHGEAQQTKASADAALTAANAKQRQADVAFEAASRMAEQHEASRVTYEGKIERLNAFMRAESSMTGPEAKATALAS